jgi:hypothetical protein
LPVEVKRDNNGDVLINRGKNTLSTQQEP